MNRSATEAIILQAHTGTGTSKLFLPRSSKINFASSRTLISCFRKRHRSC